MHIRKIALGISISLILIMFTTSCNDNSVSVNGIQQNLIQNSSFELNGQPTLSSWIVDTMWVKVVQDAPIGGGQWSIHVTAPWIPLGEGATAYVTGQSGVGVYRLSASVKPIIMDGQLSLGLWKNGYPTDVKIASRTRTDSMGWDQVTLLDTLTLHPTDSMWVHFSVNCCMARIPPDQARLDLVTLERIQ